jgi:hypothetical protein
MIVRVGCNVYGWGEQEGQNEGFPGSFATRREAWLTKAGAGKDRGKEGTRGEPKASSEVDGQSKSRGNKFDIQTAVQDR